ncbi:DUF742 domain-containing protein [Actinoalloteichus hymeniacidonis]|uniref:DUF742 family protein n=1 Tax=Actinoalloteichus hymeniacidonis TaxID=340345 RepID=A0AAC9HRP3_9PSEU|nr:DUF742 domain-containing protein [Actinoalloteichus hymeniacidonis]AOS63260.1 putative DUF742 family protein [Actinoalloteichus hymeniacidonis]MBB5908701.1 ribosomal protein L37AE/L43A [Actinoalloteichus hymeniacidonis]
MTSERYQSDQTDDDLMVGLTGARFGPTSGRRIRRAQADEDAAFAPPNQADEGRSTIGTTGARFGGAARRRRDTPEGQPRSTPTPPSGDSGHVMHIDFDRTAARLPAAFDDLDEPIWPPGLAGMDGWGAITFEESLVRPYARTGGRTSVGLDLSMETLISATAEPMPFAVAARPELRRITEICAEPCSLAEVAALIALPIGVTKVLIADLVECNGVRVHPPIDTQALVMDGAFLQRVLTGLQRL